MYALSKADKAEIPQLLLKFKTADDKDLTGYMSGQNFNLDSWLNRQIAKNKRQW